MGSSDDLGHNWSSMNDWNSVDHRDSSDNWSGMMVDSDESSISSNQEGAKDDSDLCKEIVMNYLRRCSLILRMFLGNCLEETYSVHFG